MLNILICSVIGLTKGAQDSQGQSGEPGGSEVTVWEETQSNKGKRKFSWFRLCNTNSQIPLLTVHSTFLNALQSDVPASYVSHPVLHSLFHSQTPMFS